MSTVSFNSTNQGVQDLIAALPAPAAPPTERSRGEGSGKDAKPGFNDLLRDSAETQQSQPRAEPSEPVDTQPRAESQQDEQATTDQPDETQQESQAGESSESDSQQASDNAEADQASGQEASGNSESQQKDTSAEAQVQAAANAASAELNFIEGIATDQPKVQAQNTNGQQLVGEQVKEVAGGGKQSGQNQLAAANLSVNAGLPNQSQAATGQTAQIGAAAAVQSTLQPGDQSQANSGDARGDSKSASTTTNTNAAATTNSNAATTAAFTVTDQGAGESRLPINTTGTTQSADAARQAQAQSAISTASNDSINTARLTRGLANAVQQRGGAVTMRLTPPEMGTVRIQMQITGTSVSASFHAESASAQTLLTTQLAQLRTALESKGMSVDRLSVQPMAAPAASQNSNQSQNQSDAQQQGQSQQQGAGDGRSRGQYSGSSNQQSGDQQQDGSQSQDARRGFFERLDDAAGAEAA